MAAARFIGLVVAIAAVPSISCKCCCECVWMMDGECICNFVSFDTISQSFVYVISSGMKSTTI